MDQTDSNSIGPKIYSQSPKHGETRLCLDPWTKAFIRADQQVHLCCYHTPIGSIKDNTLIEILNNNISKSYRIGLLTGDLKETCKHCGDRKLVSIDELKSSVEKWYQDQVMIIY